MFWKKKEPKTIICTECKHLVPIQYAKKVTYSNESSYGTSIRWYCPEHAPAYDKVFVEEQYAEGKWNKREYVECDEKGIIIIPKNIYES